MITIKNVRVRRKHATVDERLLQIADLNLAVMSDKIRVEHRRSPATALQYAEALVRLRALKASPSRDDSFREPVRRRIGVLLGPLPWLGRRTAVAGGG
jgi:hypothetical protein